MKADGNQLGRSYHLGSLFFYTLPNMISMVFISIYQMVDGIFVSRYIGEDALAAINITYPYEAMVVAVAMLFATGGSAIVAKTMGEGKNEDSAQFSFLCLSTILIGVFFSLVMILFEPTVLKALGAVGKINQPAREYMSILSFFFPMAMLQMFFQSFFMVAGKPKLGLFATVLAGVSNAFLDWVFVGKMNYGIKGAAVATALGYMIPTVIGIIFFIKNESGLHFSKTKYMGAVLRKTCIGGSSEMISSLAEAITTLLFNHMALRYLGEDGVAAVTIILYAQFVLTAVFYGFTTGVDPIISYDVGKKKDLLLHRIVKDCYIIVGILSAVMLCLAWCFRREIIEIFIGEESKVYQLTLHGFELFSISFLFTGINIFVAGMFTAFIKGKVAAILSFLRTFLFLTSALIMLPLLMGTDGLWIAVPFAETLGFICSVAAIWHMRID